MMLNKHLGGALLTIFITQQSAFAVITNSIYLPAFSMCHIQGAFVIWQKEYWALLTTVMVRHSKIPTFKTVYDLIVKSPREVSYNENNNLYDHIPMMESLRKTSLSKI